MKELRRGEHKKAVMAQLERQKMLLKADLVFFEGQERKLNAAESEVERCFDFKGDEVKIDEAKRRIAYKEKECTRVLPSLL